MNILTENPPGLRMRCFYHAQQQHMWNGALRNSPHLGAPRECRLVPESPRTAGPGDENRTLHVQHTFFFFQKNGWAAAGPVDPLASSHARLSR